MNGYQITFFTHQDRRFKGKQIGEWLLQLVKELGLRGASLHAGGESFARGGRMHSAHFFELADQPVEHLDDLLLLVDREIVGVARGDVADLAQDAAQAPADPAVEPGKGRQVTVLEVAVPAPEREVDVGDDFTKTVAVAAPRLRPDRVAELRDAFLAWRAQRFARTR